MKTPITPIKIPLYIKEEVKKRTKNLSKWVIEAIQEKLSKTNSSFSGKDDGR